MSLNKPQGFIAGQMARRGLHACFLNCGRIFNCIEDAKNHEGCPMRKKLEEELDTLYSMYGLDRQTVLEEERINREKKCEIFRKLLERLPKLDKNAWIEEYVNSCIFQNTT